MLPPSFFLSVTAVLQRDARSRQNLTSVSQLAKRNTTVCCSSAIFNTHSKTKTVKPRQQLIFGAFYNRPILGSDVHPKNLQEEEEI
jgi:hypothetical protein